MSIPLVQEATKDAINTSIIAIKRNIERINMLLGLSNSEEIDTSKFATKDELQQAVTDLQPVDEVAIDNMHSVSSNAVAESLSYSTTEQKTGGVWLDGKPIYRKVYTGSVSNGSTIPLNISNLGRVVRLDGYFWYANNEVLQFNNPNDNGYWSRMHISSGSFIYFLLYGFGTVNAQVYVEYTKTTD